MANDFSKTYDTANPGAAISNYEGLSSILTTLAPTETPFTSMVKKVKAKSRYELWTVDGLKSPVSTGIVEGADVGDTGGGEYADEHSERAKIGNYIQRQRRAFKVSEEQDVVESVGPADYAKAEAKALLELKRDNEKTYFSSNEMQVDAGGTTPYLTRGLGLWIGPASGQSVNAVPSAYETPASSIHTSTEGNFTETVLLDILESIWRKSGIAETMMLFANTGLKRKISDFHRLGDQTAVVRNVQYPGGSTEITNMVDIYKGDHGTVILVNGNPDCMPASTAAAEDYGTGFIINMDKVALHELVPTYSKELPDLGGGPRGFVSNTAALAVLHPQAHGKITQLTN